ATRPLRLPDRPPSFCLGSRPMRRIHAAAEGLREPTSESTVALIARLSAEHDVPPVGALGQRRHSAVISRAGIRQLAPIAVGAAVMLIATLVITAVRAPGPPALADQSA